MSMDPKTDTQRLDAFMAEYLAPPEDAGFTEAVMARAALDTVRTERERRMRRAAIYGAYAVGGVIAALQIPTLARLFESSPVAAALSSDGAQSWLSRLSGRDVLGDLPLMPLSVAAVCVALMMVWIIVSEGAELA